MAEFKFKFKGGNRTALQFNIPCCDLNCDCEHIEPDPSDSHGRPTSRVRRDVHRPKEGQSEFKDGDVIKVKDPRQARLLRVDPRFEEIQ